MPARGRPVVALAFLSNIFLSVSCSNDTGSHRNSGKNSSSGDASNSWLSLPTWTVAATGTGTSYAQACDSESAIYDTILSYGITPTNGDVLTTYWAPTTSYTAKTTRLCDGRIRAVGSLTPEEVGSSLTTNVPTVTYTGPAPSCSVQPSDCSWLHSSYLSADSSYSARLSKNPDAVPGNPPLMPRCYVSGLSDKACGQCTLHGGNVQLLYFPITTKTSRDMCATAPTSSTMCPYGPTYANNDTMSGGFVTVPCSYINTQHTSTSNSGPSTVINGTTLYSNRAYISYDTLYATNSCGRVGGTYSNGLATVASSDIFSVSGYHFELSHAAYSFNFADLIPPIPASAYLCQANCDDSGSPLGDGDSLNGEPPGKLGFCSTIIDQAFRPRLAVPPQMRAIDPVFESCLLGLDGLYDPPRLMTSDSALDGPDGSPMTTPKPEPASSVAHTTAKPTAAPEHLDDPNGKASEGGGGSDGAAPTADSDDGSGNVSPANGGDSGDAAGSIEGPSAGPKENFPNTAASQMGAAAGSDDNSGEPGGAAATPTAGPDQDGSNGAPSQQNPNAAGNDDSGGAGGAVATPTAGSGNEPSGNDAGSPSSPMDGSGNKPAGNGAGSPSSLTAGLGNEPSGNGAGSPFSPTAVAESQSPIPADASSPVGTSGTALMNGATTSDASATGQDAREGNGDNTSTTQGSLANGLSAGVGWHIGAAVCFVIGFWI